MIKIKKKKPLVSYLRLRLQVYDKEEILLFEKALSDFLKKEGLSMDFSSINLPMTKKKITLLRSPHVNKKAKDQFEIRLFNKIYVLFIFSKKNNISKESLISLLKLIDFLSKYCKTAKKVSFKIFVEGSSEFKKTIS